MHTGLAVITGTEDRQHAYVALTRGTDANFAYVFTAVPQARRPGARAEAGSRTGPLRQDSAERAGVPAPATEPAQPGTALGVLAAVLDHDGQQLSATQTRQPGPRRRRPPGPAARHLGRRDRPRPPAALPRPAPGRPAPRTPPRARPPGPVAVAHPARRRTGRPGRRAGPGRRDRRTGPGRRPRRARRPRRPDPVPARQPGPAPGRSRGPRRSPPSPTPNAAPTSPRSPR